MKIIAKIYNGFETKFGVPRQSGIADRIRSEIVFEPEYRSLDALRGLEDFSHIWLIWNFSLSERDNWSPTVRPPRLGGNRRMGVFATRSPFRPNPIGLTAVKIEEIEYEKARGPVITVTGADLVNGTPIYDIKPYLPAFDSIPDAAGGFSEETQAHSAKVVFAPGTKDNISESIADDIEILLSGDPKPSYHNDKTRVYGMRYSGLEIKFVCSNGIITVTEISK